MKGFLRLLITGLLMLVPAAPVTAGAVIHLNLDEVVGDQWRARQVKLVVGYSVHQPSARLTIGELHLSGYSAPLHDLTLNCTTLMLGGHWFTCQPEAAELVTVIAADKSIVVPIVGFNINWPTGEMVVTRLQVAPRRLPVEQLLALVPDQVSQPLLQQLTLGSGELSGELDVLFQGGQLASLKGTLAITDLAFSNEMGTNAGENLAAQVDLSATAGHDSMDFKVNVEVIGGDLFLNPLFFSWGPADSQPLVQRPPSLRVSGDWIAGQQQLNFNVGYRQPGQFELALGGRVVFGNQQFQLLSGFGRLDVTQLNDTYAGYLQPLLVDSQLGDMQLDGELLARISYQQGKGITSLGLQLDQVDLIDRQGRFAITGLSAALPWRGAQQSSNGELRWEKLQLYRLPFGAGSSTLRFQPGQLDLQISPVALFDGHFSAGKITVRGLGTDQLQLAMAGALTPVSLEALTEALGWPQMAGTLAAKLPAIHYRRGRIELDGGLQVAVFDGELAMSNLVVEDIFGLVPRLSADLRMEQLDLALLTQTFGFGAITGRISGQVNQLQLEAWQPVAFDGWLQTPDGDPGRHRISQRALDSLSSIGGISGALQSTMLRFFDDFSYRQLGIGCRLQNGVCQMRGIADHGEGYAIIQGGGWWPRIDLIGYNRRVDWQVLVARLIAATDVESVEIR